MAEINAKILVWGLHHSGKTTNLRFIHGKLRADHRGELQSFDMDQTPYQVLPIELGEVQGFATRLKLYALPGSLEGKAIRESLSQDGVGIIFVVDSQVGKIGDNLRLYQEMLQLFDHCGIDPKQFPVVVQYNKFDLPTAAPIDELQQKINTLNYPFFKAVAKEGTGVLATLSSVSKSVIRYLKQRGPHLKVGSAPPPDLSLTQPVLMPNLSTHDGNALVIKKMRSLTALHDGSQELLVQLLEPQTGRIFTTTFHVRTEIHPEGMLIKFNPK